MPSVADRIGSLALLRIQASLGLSVFQEPFFLR